MDTSAYWDRYTTEYLSNQTATNACSRRYIKLFYNQLVALALNRLNLTKETRILKVDLWNEGVETSRDILGNLPVFDTIGFDFSKNVCRLAKNRLDHSGVVQAACRSLPFSSENFDLLLDLSTIDHVPFAKTKEIFAEYYRVIKPEGLLAVAFWQSNLATKYLLHVDPEQLYFDSKKVAGALEELGFEIIDSYNTGALLTVMDSNFWLSQFLFWRLKTVFEDKLFTSTARWEPYLSNWLGGLHVFYARHP
jgi:SAM-dependent methyltransferase